ncbi:MAG: (d)CMP kinase [Chloroflexota bacterium]
MNLIAIDGPVASGKTVVGRELALMLGFEFLDTGIMYRTITWLALRHGIQIGDEPALVELANRHPVRLAGAGSDRVLVGEHALGPELREASVDSHVSLVSRVPGVRRALVRQQRDLARRGRIVMVGRDIGTVVLPGADLKVFLSASPEQRSRRRWQELISQGKITELQEVLRETKARDEIDSQRADSPLVPARDAFLLDTEGLSVDQVVQRLMDRVHQLNRDCQR